MTPLPVVAAYRLGEQAEEQRWLVADLWSEQAVGIIGGEPKCCKSFLALDLALAVAAGRPCLRRFAVPNPGRVLLYAAEDALHIVRRRLDRICAAAAVDLADLVQRAAALALEVVERQSHVQPAVEPNTLDDRIAAALAEAGQPQPFADLRASCRVRAATLYERIAAMTIAGRIIKSHDGYRLAG